MEHPIGIQRRGQSFVELTNGVILATRTGRAGNGTGVICSESKDAGRTWQRLSVIASDAPGADIGDGHLMVSAKGDVWYSYRHNHSRGKSPGQNDYSIRIAVSHDQGKTWTPHSTVQSVTPDSSGKRGLWSSFLLERPDGSIQCYYDDENAAYLAGFPGHQWLQMKTWLPSLQKWTNEVTVSRAFNPRHLSRDGMPIVVALSSNRLIAAFESCDVTPPHPNVIRFVTSDDGGKNWSWQSTERQILYQAPKTGHMCVSPWLIRLTSGTLLCCFTTDENRSKPDRAGSPPHLFNMDVKYVTSTDEGATWSQSAILINSENHHDYMPGIAELIHSNNQIFCLWLDTSRGFRAKTGIIKK